MGDRLLPWPIGGVQDIVLIVARNVRAARERVGLSQEDLAYKAAVDRSYLWGIERGTRNPSVLVVAKLAEALGVKAAELLADDRP